MTDPTFVTVNDTQNFGEISRRVSVREPAFLAKSGGEKYALIDIRDYERMKATISLLSELRKGEKSAEKYGWRTIEEAEAYLGIK